MGLIGLLHRNISHSTTKTEVYFASNGNRDDLKNLTLFHGHSYFQSQGAKEYVPNCRFGEHDLALLQGNDVLYKGKQPFVIAQVSDAELNYICNVERYLDQSFIDEVLTPYAAKHGRFEQKLKEMFYPVEKFIQMPISEFVNQPSTQEKYANDFFLNESSLKNTNQSEESRIVQGYVSEFKSAIKDKTDELIKEFGLEDKFEEPNRAFVGRGSAVMKEIRVIDMLLDLKNTEGRNIVDFNDREHPYKLLELIGMRY